VRSTGGIRNDFKGYMAGNMLLNIVPEFCQLSDEL
jgi:hypothetical protein